MTIVFAAVLPLQQIVSESVDKRIAGKDPAKAHRRLSGKFAPNPYFWASDVDFSCLSPRSDRFGGLRGGTLVSKRHFLFAWHFPIPKDTRLHFLDAAGQVCTCSVDAIRKVGNEDIGVGLLNAEVTPDIHPVKILPTDFTNYVGTAEGLPVVAFDQEGKALVLDLHAIPTESKRWAMFTRKPKDASRLSYYERIIPGDSGQPCFMIVGKEPILLYCHKMPGGGGGPAIHMEARQIQAVMDELCPGYKLEAFDFSRLIERN